MLYARTCDEYCNANASLQAGLSILQTWPNSQSKINNHSIHDVLSIQKRTSSRKRRIKYLAMRRYARQRCIDRTHTSVRHVSTSSPIYRPEAEARRVSFSINTHLRTSGLHHPADEREPMFISLCCLCTEPHRHRFLSIGSTEVLVCRRKDAR